MSPRLEQKVVNGVDKVGTESPEQEQMPGRSDAELVLGARVRT